MLARKKRGKKICFCVGGEKMSSVNISADFCGEGKWQIWLYSWAYVCWWHSKKKGGRGRRELPRRPPSHTERKGDERKEQYHAPLPLSLARSLLSGVTKRPTESRCVWASRRSPLHTYVFVADVGHAAKSTKRRREEKRYDSFGFRSDLRRSYSTMTLKIQIVVM